VKFNSSKTQGRLQLSDREAEPSPRKVRRGAVQGKGGRTEKEIITQEGRGTVAGLSSEKKLGRERQPAGRSVKKGPCWEFIVPPRKEIGTDPCGDFGA